MKILYAIQGTGNGHISRAREIIPILSKYCELDILISGTQADVFLPYHIKYQLKGLSFIFGKKGGINFLDTYLKNNTMRVLKEVREVPVAQYDLVINDFEPITAWACKNQNIPCIGLSHQSAVLNPKAPQPSFSDPIGKFILNKYAPTQDTIGFHFERYDSNIFTPVIRSEVRELIVKNEGHYTVYLPSFEESYLIKKLKKISDVEWRIFSKHAKEKSKDKNVKVYPIDNKKFLRSLASGAGLLTGAGFESPAEALFLEKKVLVIPMKQQFEQHCNAAALQSLGVPVIKNLKKKNFAFVEEWVQNGKAPAVDYPDQTKFIIESIINKYQNPI